MQKIDALRQEIKSFESEIGVDLASVSSGATSAESNASDRL